MTELLIKTIIGQARQLQRMDTQACDDLSLKARIEELDQEYTDLEKRYIDLKKRHESHVDELLERNAELPCPASMEKLELVNRDLQEGIQMLHNEIRSQKDRIKELEAPEQNANKLGYYRYTKGLEQEIEDLKLKVQSYNPNEFMVEEPECPTEFTLHNVKYFEDTTGCYMIANNGVDHFNVKITGQEYLDGVNQWRNQDN